MLKQQLGVWKETFAPEKGLATETGNKEMLKIILNIHRDEVVIEGQTGHDDCISPTISLPGNPLWQQNYYRERPIFPGSSRL